MELTQKLAIELLHYNPDTGQFTWRQRGREWFKSDRSHKIWNARFSGKPAGSVESKALGYQRVSIRIFGKAYKAHRIAWLYVEGSPVPDEIDHIDRDATNNKWNNLRKSSRVENHRNLSMFRNNTSGVSGVSWSKTREKWEVQITCGKKHNLGYFDDLDEARIVAQEFRSKHGFSPGHGESMAKYHAGAS